MKIDYSIFNQETAIDRFIFAVENKYYVEAHELLEDDWNEFKRQGQREKALVLKGLINGATALALYHIKKKPHGHKKVWPAFEKYIPLLDEVELDQKEKFYKAKELLIELNNKLITE
ncbi:DUF309 domain-containing protein [Poseidonibacter lekithochrous]|uniref:DUF309 domain-containing protein n=1 Tax=Poseidonibacter lekithochrous TaxID=1904463 RepID=UPI0008FC88A0|nr:DUF309 domain-containing protein [Poseidonibacter lekithochrous]QKJ23454.1 hypothetical protein ALEK_2194 [Poseidonibacter lekithochrous]